VTAAIVIIELAAALMIAIQAIQRINCMSRCTALPWFAAWCVLGGSAAAVAASVLAGQSVPDIYSALVMTGAATVFTIDRRRR
jgi:FtsH-binding integral membrane protein